MDGHRFDDLTRSLARGTSRRTFLTGLAGAAVAAVTGGTTVGAKESQKDKDDGIWKQKCKSPGDCPTGAVCRNNHCGCPPGTTRCHVGTTFEACIDLRSNRDNCGACGIGCGENLDCIGGQCACDGVLTHCPESGCTDTATDPTNCGRCGALCAFGLRCVFGVCACPEGESACQGPGGGSVCRDTTSDALNCGECGRVCADGRVCQGGSCVCASNLASCGDACVNLGSDPGHCGRCNNACVAGQSCVGGQCGCPDGLASCGGACVDRQTDARHCGFCNWACGSCEECVAGACLPSGPGCCPGEETPCVGADGFTCCGPSDYCCAGACISLDLSCCTDEQIYCETIGACCPADQICGPDGCTCGQGETACPTVDGDFACCNRFSACCHGRCIPTGETCCPPVEEACLGTCCPAGQECGDAGCCTRCGVECCPAGEQCCNGACIPAAELCCEAGEPCGDYCCAAGDACYAIPGDPFGPFCCPAAGGACPGGLCCSAADGYTCCAQEVNGEVIGVCCGAGETCGLSAGGPYCCPAGTSPSEGGCITACDACTLAGNICCTHETGIQTCCDPDSVFPICTLNGCCAEGRVSANGYCY